MENTYEDNPKSIKYYVKRFIIENKSYFSGKTVIDLPAGNGITSRILKENGAIVKPFDLFPEYFNIEGLTCEKADISKAIPVTNKSADCIICQEGIEHFSDQFQPLVEFNRVLKKGGRLVITTPNYSNIRARMSYFLSESERFNDMMPPNELDSIWMSSQENTDDIYFGHVFLIGIQKLRVLAKLAGFKIIEIRKTRWKSTSVLLFPFFYPFIYLSNLISYRKSMRKQQDFDTKTKKEVYGESFKLGTSLKTLLDGHLFVVFEKEKDSSEVSQTLKSKHSSFNTIT